MNGSVGNMDPHSRNSNSVSNSQVNASHNLDFDPAAVIDGGGEGQEGLDVSRALASQSPFLNPFNTI